MSDVGGRPSIGLCLIVRNEEHSIARCLESVKGEVDDLLVFDTGSTDATPAVARAHGATVEALRWPGSFAAARNVALSRLQSDWVLLIDADEQVAPEDRGRLSELVRRGGEGYYLPVLSHLGGGPDDYIVDYRLSLFRRRPEYCFQGLVHEEVVGAIRSARPGTPLPVAPLHILHYGYRDGAALGRKGRRNRSLLRRALAEGRDPRSVYALAVEELRRGRIRPALLLLGEVRERTPADDPVYSDVLRQIAVAAISVGDAAAAEEALDEGIRLFPCLTDLSFLRGALGVLRGDLREAALAYRHCLALGEAPVGFASLHGVGSFRAHAALATIDLGEGRHRQAYRRYVQALATGPGWRAPAQPLALLLIGMPEPSARDCLREMRSAVGEAVRELAPHLWRAGRRDLAWRAACPGRSPLPTDYRWLAERLWPRPVPD